MSAELLAPRDVPFGGFRGIPVERLLPQRRLPTIGAWCFLDLFGPTRQPMIVLPHPHTGLQTVTWPLTGEIRHRDSLGNDVLVRPGELNLMTAGRGVAHSEVSGDDGALLHGLQLWVALPASRADGAPGFERHTDLPVHTAPGLRATVFAGTLGDAVAPTTTHSPLVGADVLIGAGGTTLPLRPDFEHGLLTIDGTMCLDGVAVAAHRLLYLGPGRGEVDVTTGGGPVRAVLIGGEPFADDLVMWWNFVGRDHAEIVAARADWEHGGRFGTVAGHGADRVPAPPLPPVRLTPRRRRPVTT